MADEIKWGVISRPTGYRQVRVDLVMTEPIRKFVGDDVTVTVDYSDRDNPVIKLCRKGDDKPFATGTIGDCLIDDNGTFRFVKPSEIKDKH